MPKIKTSASAADTVKPATTAKPKAATTAKSKTATTAKPNAAASAKPKAATCAKAKKATTGMPKDAATAKPKAASAKRSLKAKGKGAGSVGSKPVEAAAVGAGDEERIYGFEAFVPDGATVLILGSMPSVKSLEQGFYYAHPQNRMFKLIARYLTLKQTGSCDNAVPLTTVEERKAALSELGIAMWDTVDSCVRAGSLDSSIKAASYADITGLLRKHPSISCVITAGGFSAKAFKKSTLSLPEVESGELSFEYYALPSTSPANTVSFEKICEAYDAAILPHLKINDPTSIH